MGDVTVEQAPTAAEVTSKQNEEGERLRPEGPLRITMYNVNVNKRNKVGMGGTHS